MNAVRHVEIALALTAILFIIAGDRWSERISSIHPVAPAPRRAS